MRASTQGALSWEECEALKKESYTDWTEGRIDEAQHFVDIEETHWHRFGDDCPFPEYIRHRIRANLAVGNHPPAEILVLYEPVTGTFKIAPGDTLYFSRGVPKSHLRHIKQCYADLIATAKKKACAVSAAAGFGMANLTAIFD